VNAGRATAWTAGLGLAVVLGIMFAGRGGSTADESSRGVEAVEGRDPEPTDSYFDQARRRDGGTAAAALGRRILREFAADPGVLESLAWGILTDESLRHRDLALALEAATAAAAAAGDGIDVLETRARALFMTGRRADAIAVQRRAVELAADDPVTRLFLEETLRGYEQPAVDPGPTDEELIRRIESRALELVDAGEAVSAADLLATASTGPATIELAAPAAERLDAESLYERVRPSVVVIAALEPDLETGELEVAVASGFVIHPAGVVVTNFHVIDVPESPVLVAMTAGGSVHPVSEVLAVSPRSDIAICRLAGDHDLPALALAAPARPGTRLLALSHPDAAFWSLTEGILSRFFVVREGGEPRTMFTTTADFAVGSSGGPLIDERGDVVGMVSSTLAIYAADGSVRRQAGGAVRQAARRRGLGDGRCRQAAPPVPETDQPAGDFQMGLNMCVPAADIRRLAEGGR